MLVIKVHAATLDVGSGYPYADIQLAINAAIPGDTILVHPGVYIERGPFPIGYVQPSDQYAPPVIVYKDGLTIKSTGGPGVTSITCSLTFWLNPKAIQISTGGALINPSSTAPSAVIIIANHVTIDGFTIVANYVGDPGTTSHPNTAGVFIGALAAGYTGYPWDGTGYATIQNNIISGWSGIYIWKSPGNVIQHNTITIVPPIPSYANVPPGDGIEVWDGWHQGDPAISSAGLVVMGNQILGTPLVKNSGPGEYDIAKGIAIGGAPGADRSATIGYCNTITNWVHGIDIWNSPTGTFTIHDCKVYGNTEYGMSVSTATADARNVYWGDPTGPYHLTLNPSGLGNPVSDNVNFIPWKHIASCNPECHLTVTSPYDTPTGQGWYDTGSTVTSSVTSPAGNEWCMGWTGTGSVPPSGAMRTVTFTITQDSTITWNWAYGALLGPSVGGQWAPITMQALTPINAFQLAPWIALAFIAAATAVAAYRRLLKKHW
jgi:parallel beta-helix repeat protein